MLPACAHIADVVFLLLRMELVVGRRPSRARTLCESREVESNEERPS
jgi:hypothetical protein